MFSAPIRSSTIRLVLFISSLVIATILVFQLVWLRKIYNFEQKEFTHNVMKAIRGLYEDLDISLYNSSHLNELVENPAPNLYIAQINLPEGRDSLISYLHYELDDFGVFTECHVGIYNRDSAKYVYTGILAPTPNSVALKVPPTPRSHDHITLFFPKRQQYILTRMNFWIISSVVLFLVLILFGGSLYYFYKQKFLNETQKDFIHNFTHEFKTPVAVISLAADVLKNPAIVEKPDKLVTYAGIVENQSTYLQNQIERLLKFAYTDSNQLHLTPEKVNIHDLIQEALRNLSPLIAEKKAHFNLSLDAADPSLLADKEYLVIVITNLIDNAIKYSRNPQVHISTGNTAGFTYFTVQDNGIGIERKQLNKIFKRFFRVRHGETYNAKGFGLGLSFVKKIVDAHRGKIKVESVPGKGSSFTVSLPVS
ncbi:MAG TPA: HAMP domain-containing sensor histidine kinase [Chitinophagaceae bacterium]|nr:HAMP domain-containing sensor histidine kinase [Chitinophagaceae bacterium]